MRELQIHNYKFLISAEHDPALQDHIPQLIALIERAGGTVVRELSSGRWDRPTFFVYAQNDAPPTWREAGVWPVPLDRMLDHLQVGWDAQKRVSWLKDQAQLPVGQKSRWGRVVEALSLLLDDEVPSVLSEILPLLDTWPDEERAFPLPWVQEILSGTANPRHKAAVYLQLSGRDKFKAAMQNSHLFAHIRFFRPNHSSLGLEEAKLLADCPHLGNMTGLDLMYNHLGPMGTYWLKQAVSFGSLKTLDIRYNGLKEGGASGLAECPWLSQLTDLNIEGNEITNKGLQALLSSPHLGELESLNISHCHLKGPAGKLLAQSPKLMGLKKLLIKYNDLKAPGANSLGKAPFLALEELNIGCNEIGDKGMAGLVKASWSGWLKVLEVEGNFRDPLVGDAGIEALAQKPMPNLQKLNLEKNSITGVGLARLIGSSTLPALQELILGWNSFTAVDMDGLAKTIPVFSLKSLKISSFSLQGHNVWDLPVFEGIEEIDGPFLELHAQDAAWMARSPRLKKLKRFNFMDSPFGVEGLKHLTQADAFPCLEELHLSGAKLNDEAVSVIEASGCLGRLRVLALSDKELTEDAQNRLRKLKVNYNSDIWL